MPQMSIQQYTEPRWKSPKHSQPRGEKGWKWWKAYNLLIKGLQPFFLRGLLSLVGTNATVPRKMKWKL